MYECIKETKSDKLPENKHSTKGIGSTQPDPEATKLLLEDIEVPLGKAREDPQVKSSLLHNEYPFQRALIIILIILQKLYHLN